MPICSSSSTNTTGFRFRTLGTWKAQSMMSAIPVKLHRVGWCFAPTAHTSAAIQLNENCSCFYNNARLFFFKIKSAIGFIMSLSMLGSHFNWTLSGTTLQLPGSSFDLQIASELVWKLKPFHPPAPTHQLKVTDHTNASAFEVDRSWAKCNRNNLFNFPLNDGSWAQNQNIQQFWQPNSLGLKFEPDNLTGDGG